MDKLDRLKVFHTLPMSIDCYPYLQWHEDPRLRMYIHRAIDRNSLPPDVTEIARELVARLKLLPPERKEYSQGDRDLCGCATAFLAGILLSQRRGNWLKADLFEKLQKHGSTLELSDVYAIGLQVLSDPQRLLRGFAPDPKLVWLEVLSAYSQRKFQRSLIDGIRKLPGLTHFKRTNLGMLVRTSDARIKAALIAGGERDERLEIMLLLQQCFKETVKAKKFETQNPQPAHYRELLARYTKQAGTAPLAIADPDRLKELLTAMGNILRNYEQPQLDSLDRPLGHLETDRVMLLGDAIDTNATDSDRPVGEQIADGLSSVELLVAGQNLRQQVVELLEQLSGDRDRLLMLVSGLQLNQKAAGLELGCHQTNVHRRRDALLLELTRQCQQLALGALTAELLAPLVKSLKEICEDYYSELLVGILKEIEPPNNTAEISQAFIDRVQTRWQFTFHPERQGATKAEEFVQLRSHLLL